VNIKLTALGKSFSTFNKFTNKRFITRMMASMNFEIACQQIFDHIDYNYIQTF
jgi:hypothetical protein